MAWLNSCLIFSDHNLPKFHLGTVLVSDKALSFGPRALIRGLSLQP